MPYSHGVVSVTTSPTLIATPSSIPENGGLLVQNLSAQVLYIGGPTVTAGVTATGGIQIAASPSAAVLVPTTGAGNEVLYGVVAATTAKVATLYPA